MLLACFMNILNNCCFLVSQVLDFILTGEKKSLLGHNSKENQFLLFSTRILVRLSVTILCWMPLRGRWSCLLGFTQKWSVFYCSRLLSGLIAGVRLCLIFRIGVVWMLLNTFLHGLRSALCHCACFLFGSKHWFTTNDLFPFFFFFNSMQMNKVCVEDCQLCFLSGFRTKDRTDNETLFHPFLLYAGSVSMFCN